VTISKEKSYTQSHSKSYAVKYLAH